MDTDAADTAKGPAEDEAEDPGANDERQGSFWSGDGTPPDSAAAARSRDTPQGRRRGPSQDEPAGDASPAEVSPASGSVAAADGGPADGPAGADEEDGPEEVRELRNALRMLVYERDVVSIYNGGPPAEPRGGTDEDDGWAPTEGPRRDRTGPAGPGPGGRGTSDAGLNSIPGLVNRVIEEHYAGTERRARPPPARDGTMTELLLAVIVEFAEPHLARAARRRLAGRGGGEGGRSGGRRGGDPARKRRRNGDDDGDDGGALSSYDERAVSWSESCLRQVLRSGGGGDGGRRRWAIPELDALLGATGVHDGAAMDDDVREAVLLGFRAQRSLSGSGGGATEGRGEGQYRSASRKYPRRGEIPL